MVPVARPSFKLARPLRATLIPVKIARSPTLRPLAVTPTLAIILYSIAQLFLALMIHVMEVNSMLLLPHAPAFRVVILLCFIFHAVMAVAVQAALPHAALWLVFVATSFLEEPIRIGGILYVPPFQYPQPM